MTARPHKKTQIALKSMGARPHLKSAQNYSGEHNMRLTDSNILMRKRAWPRMNVPD